MRDLPMPGSPESRTIWLSPAFARAQKRRTLGDLAVRRTVRVDRR